MQSQPRSRKPVSVRRRTVPAPDGDNSNVTSNELDIVAVWPSPCVQRNERRWGGWTSITVIGTTSTLHDASSRHVNSLVEPATGSSSVLGAPPVLDVLGTADDIECDLG